MLNLPHQQVTTAIAFAWVETIDIKALVVKAVEDNFVLGKERKQSGVQVNFTEKVEVADILNRYGLALDLPIIAFLLKADCVLPPLQSSAPEDVAGLRHLSLTPNKVRSKCKHG